MKFILRVPIFFFYLLYPLKVYGKENMPEGGAVLVSNHYRAIDCGYIVRAYKGEIKFLAKKEIFKNKLFSKIVKAYGGIPIDRENPDMHSMITAIKTIKSNEKLCIFPEGTRNNSKSGELQEIKGGAVVFAVKAKCPIVPMMFLKKGKIFKREKLIIGKPFTLDEFYDKKLSDEDIKKMEEIVRLKMIEQHDLLKEMSRKRKK